MSRCVVCNGHFIFVLFSVCQIVFVGPGYDRRLSTRSAGTNDLCSAVEALTPTYLRTYALFSRNGLEVQLTTKSVSQSINQPINQSIV